MDILICSFGLQAFSQILQLKVTTLTHTLQNSCFLQNQIVVLE